MSQNNVVSRIAVFFDGGYFDEVSKFYKFQHSRGARLSISGIHEFCRAMVADREKTEASRTQLIESHYFRGRFDAGRLEAAGKLKDQAAFDDVLMRAGVTPHFAPMTQAAESRREQGVDVALALEAFDLALSGRVDVIALVACDGDFVPLARKVAACGVRILLLGWEFRYHQDKGGKSVTRETRMSADLLRACAYPIMMNSVIDDRSRANDPLINGLFVPKADAKAAA